MHGYHPVNDYDIILYIYNSRTQSKDKGNSLQHMILFKLMSQFGKILAKTIYIQIYIACKYSRSICIYLLDKVQLYGCLRHAVTQKPSEERGCKRHTSQTPHTFRHSQLEFILIFLARWFKWAINMFIIPFKSYKKKWNRSLHHSPSHFCHLSSSSHSVIAMVSGRSAETTVSGTFPEVLKRSCGPKTRKQIQWSNDLDFGIENNNPMTSCFVSVHFPTQSND